MVGIGLNLIVLVRTAIAPYRYLSDVSSSPIKGPRCFLEQETLL